MPLYAGNDAESEEDSTRVHPGATGVWLQSDARCYENGHFLVLCNLCSLGGASSVCLCI